MRRQGQNDESEIRMIKMMLEESPGVRIRREDPGEHDGRIEAHEEPHNAASLTSSKSFVFILLVKIHYSSLKSVHWRWR